MSRVKGAILGHFDEHCTAYRMCELAGNHLLRSGEGCLHLRFKTMLVAMKEEPEETAAAVASRGSRGSCSMVSTSVENTRLVCRRGRRSRQSRGKRR